MGQSSAQTVKEIEETRDRLDSQIRVLEDRMPRPALWAKRLAGVAAGGGAAGTAFWFLARRRRKQKAEKVMQTAFVPVQTVIRVLPEDWGKRVGKSLENGEWKGWVTMGAGAWVLLRLAELRQLRRMNRVLIAAR
jgi:hypothetical protein